MRVIVPALAEDAATILAIQKRAFAEEARLCDDPAIPPLTEPLEAVIGHIATATVLTARIGTQVVGSVRGLIADAVCTIRALSIAPELQGCGIGSELLSAIEQAHPHVARFELMTNTAIESNVRFYQRHGYRVTELQRYSERIVLARMSKAAVARDARDPAS